MLHISSNDTANLMWEGFWKALLQLLKEYGEVERDMDGSTCVWTVFNLPHTDNELAEKITQLAAHHRIKPLTVTAEIGLGPGHTAFHKLPQADSLTVTIQIGNSDNKLDQMDWADFCQDLHAAVEDYDLHFFAPSAGNAPWQNCAAVIALKPNDLTVLKNRLRKLAATYRQESIALAIGTTEFLPPATIDIETAAAVVEPAAKPPYRGLVTDLSFDDLLVDASERLDKLLNTDDLDGPAIAAWWREWEVKIGVEEANRIFRTANRDAPVRFTAQHKMFKEKPPLEFTDRDAPDWLTSVNTVKGSTTDQRWFWVKHVRTLTVGESVDTDFHTITRIE